MRGGGGGEIEMSDNRNIEVLAVLTVRYRKNLHNMDLKLYVLSMQTLQLHMLSHKRVLSLRVGNKSIACM